MRQLQLTRVRKGTVQHRRHARAIRDGRSNRRGTMYVIVLMASLIVASIGFASLQLLRVQGQAGTETRDFMESRLLARSAVEIGMLKIRNDPYWRRNLGNGTWITNQTIGTGKFSLSAADPVDDNVAVGENHPVILTGTGMYGNAVFKSSVRLEVGPRTGSCLEVSMLSGDDTTVTGATLTSDQTVAANDDFAAGSGSTVDANVEAADAITGGTYSKAKATQTARDLPSSSSLINEYISRGTAFSYTAIPQWTRPEMLSNGTFESSSSGWTSVGSCSLIRTFLINRNGLYSLYVYNRGSAASVAAQSLSAGSLALLLNGNSYNLTLPILCGNNCTAQATLTITASGSGTQTFTTPITNVSANNWTSITGTVVPTWTGTLTQATVSVLPSGTSDYALDDATMTDVTFPKNAYVITRRLISPTSNPFGFTNSSGIYVINCSGKDVIVADSRLVGTLVLRQPGSNSAIQRSVSWEPAIYNYPALLSEDSISIQLGAAGLSESMIGINLNPTNAPFPFVGGTTNSDTLDSYPSKITGLIYSATDLTFSGSSTISGVVITNRDIYVNGTSLTLNYLNVYLNDPPPGFTAGTAQMKVVPGSWQRTVN